jgi:hypothetical protein
MKNLKLIPLSIADCRVGDLVCVLPEQRKTNGELKPGIYLIIRKNEEGPNSMHVNIEFDRNFAEPGFSCLSLNCWFENKKVFQKIVFLEEEG